MIVSVNWLKKFVAIDIPIDELAEQIGARLVEIEGVKPLSEKYKDVIIAKVVTCEPVPDSDHLNLTTIDDGGKANGVERNEKGHVQVVCGAPNIAAGQTVAWLPPNSVVPETFGTSEPFVLGARKLRGYMSNGMIASAKELDLFEDHTGILELDRSFRAGESFAKALELDDYLLDIENKSLTHRPDTFGIIGFAREIAGILGKPFKTPDWLLDTAPSIEYTDDERVTASIENEALSARYSAIVLGNIDASKPSPVWLQTYLARANVRPVNVVVDVLNYTMLLTGQPTHAFDYDKTAKLGGGAINLIVRGGNEHETLTLLDGRTIALDASDIIVANGKTPITLAGAMGGADTAVDSSTKKVILESATFNLYNLRTTQMRHGIFSEAITRFTKGQPAALTAPVLAETVRLLQELAGATVISPLTDTYPITTTPQVVSVSQATINETLGSDFDTAVLVSTLENVEFEVAVKSPATLLATAPFWRADIHIPEDIIEEVGRLNGFDGVLPTLPLREGRAVASSAFDQLRTRVRKGLVRAGATEVLTYSFVHGDLMRHAGQETRDAYRIVNSISPDLQYYRQSIVPSLLSHVYANIRAGYKHFALFELNKYHTKREPETNEKVPTEIDSLGFVVAQSTKQPGAAYYEAKQYLEYLASQLGVELGYESLEPSHDYPLSQPFEYRRSARVYEKQTHTRLGVIGEFKNSVKKALKLPEHVAGFELELNALFAMSSEVTSTYAPLSKYPSTERDVCLQVNADVAYADVAGALTSALATDEFTVGVVPIDIYQPDTTDKKNITFRITIGSLTRTLTSDEVNNFVGGAASAAAKKLSATII